LLLGSLVVLFLTVGPVGADLAWFGGGMVESDLNTFLGGAATTYEFEDQTVNDGDPANYVGNGTAPDYGFTWTTNPGGGTKGWAPDNPASSWGTGTVDGSSGQVLINTNNAWATLVPVGVDKFDAGLGGVGSLVGCDGSQGGSPITVTVYDVNGDPLGSNTYALQANGDSGNVELFWGVTSTSADIWGFKFSDSSYFMMDKLKLTATPAPEPATMAFLALGGAALLVRRRRHV
jgi:hypothetical protein